MSIVRLVRALASIAMVVSLAACNGATPTATASATSAGSEPPGPPQVGSAPAASAVAESTSPASGSRPSSPAVVTIVSPASGAAVTGDSVHVVLALAGAEIVSATTTNIRPDQGHVHLYVDNVLVSMNYGLEQDLPVHSGTYLLKAEFVASDHAPFSPRVWSPEVLFTVK